ncbi:MAG: hypothetical protein QOG68_2367 [Solirubrobacteraceae bacterium]|nr:hypothetical protein [Solirubrobacteraceae bacterium]
MHTATQVLAIGAAACFIAATLTLLRVHLLPTGLTPLSDAVSDYGAGAYHRYYRAMVVLLGAGTGLLVVGLARDSEAGALGLTFLGIYAAARLAIAWFMTDLPGRPVTTEGRVHLVLAAIAFTSIAFGASDVTTSVQDSPGWNGGVSGVLLFESRAIVVTAVLTLVAYLVPQVRERAFGAVERLLYVAGVAWLVTTATHLAVLAAGG